MLLLPFVAFYGLVCAANVPGAASSKPQVERAAWYHEKDHPVARLFRRQNTSKPPAVGSPEWTAQYPDPGAFPPKQLPQAWVDTLNAAIAAGKIPNVPVPVMGSSGNPVYPNGLNPVSTQVCSSTYQCRLAGDIWDAPNGTVGLAFDDGPLPPSPKLYTFLKQNNQHATHFFIGSNILYNPTVFLQAFQDNQDDIAVHTYTHPYMTTKDNMGVLAELGYTVQIIYDSTGGRVPKYWRPPYGDADNRVRAIAKEVFGLTTVIWNNDSEDWMIGSGQTTLAKVEASLKSFYAKPKSPGLVILEHELTDSSVQAFMYSYPLLVAGGWKPLTIPDISTDATRSWYQNAINDTAPVNTMSVGVGPGSVAPPPSSSSTPASSTGAPTSSGTGSGTSTHAPSSSGSSGSSTSAPSPTNSPNSSLRVSTSSWMSVMAGLFIFTASLT